jgi:hypothetical protein
MITKLRYFHKPTYDTFEASLIAMRDHMSSSSLIICSSSLKLTASFSITWSDSTIYAAYWLRSRPAAVAKSPGTDCESLPRHWRHNFCLLDLTYHPTHIRTC